MRSLEVLSANITRLNRVCGSRPFTLLLLFTTTVDKCLKEENVDKGKLNFQGSRHPFATAITLSNGVPIETVGKMLGHRNLKTTQHYARILDNKIAANMQALKSKLEQRVGDNRLDQ